MISVLKLKYLSDFLMKDHATLSKAFSKSMRSKIPGFFNLRLEYKISYIKRKQSLFFVSKVQLYR